MNNRDKIEFYDGSKMIAVVTTSIVPPVGSKLSIRGEVWEVMRVTYAVDRADQILETGMRANLDVERRW